jgi:cytidylate kinase
MAPDAIHIETTGVPIESVVERVMTMVDSFIAGKNGRV